MEAPRWLPQYSPAELSTDPVFDRPGLALKNLLAGDFSGAGRALYDPGSLSPEERKTLAERWGVGGTPLEVILEVSTNPLVIAGLLLSMKYPTPSADSLAGFRGGVEKLASRMPWAKYISPVSENYLGTKIPGLLQTALRERTTVQKFIVEGWADILQGRVLSLDEQLKVAALMDDLGNPHHPVWGQARSFLRKKKLDPLADALENPLPQLADAPADLRDIARRTQGLLNRAWDKWLADPDNQQRLRRILGRRIGFQSHLSAGELKQIANYWPHTRSMTPEERLSTIREWAKEFVGSKAQRAANRGLELRQAPAATADRFGKMMPDPAHLRLLGASDDVIAAVSWRDEAAIAHAINAGEYVGPNAAVTALDHIGRPIYYTLKYAEGVSHYIDDLSRAVAFSIPPVKYAGPQTPSIGERLRESMNNILDEGTDAARLAVRTLEDTIIPQVAGGLSVKQSERAMMWGAAKERAVRWLSHPAAIKALGSQQPKLVRWLTEDPGSSYYSVGSDIASHLYRSALGLPNVVPSMLNLLQPAATVGPLGIEYLTAGMADAAKQLTKYAELRLSKGVSKWKAMEQALDTDFIAGHLELNPTSQEAVIDQMEAIVKRAFPGVSKIGRWTDKLGDRLMGLFSHTEMYNRLSTFSAMKRKGMAELSSWWFPDTDQVVQLAKSASDPARRKAAAEFANQMTRATQFGSGPLERPQGTLNMWAPWAQFTTFPLRMLGLAIGPMMRNPGYIGRAAAMSGALYETAQHMLGTDISRGLLFGGLPEPSGMGPFPVLPVVPPAAQIAGGAVLSLVTGESEHIRRSLPLLVPGGIGLARMLPMAPGGSAVGQTVKKTYARWDMQTPDGRVPVYTGDDQLRGYYTPGQVLAASLGLGDVAGEREALLTKYILGQRDAIRGLKRQYMEALGQNDPQAAIRVQEEYERRYPGMGGLPVGNSDIRSLHLREDVTRLERLMETMPPELREEFHGVLSTTFGAIYPQVLGLMRPLDQAPTISLREPYRLRPASGTQQRVNRGLHGVHFREKLRNEGLDVSNAGVREGVYYTETDGVGPYY